MELLLLILSFWVSLFVFFNEKLLELEFGLISKLILILSQKEITKRKNFVINKK